MSCGGTAIEHKLLGEAMARHLNYKENVEFWQKSHMYGFKAAIDDYKSLKEEFDELSETRQAKVLELLTERVDVARRELLRQCLWTISE